MARVHLQEELVNTATPLTVETRFGSVRGGRAANGAVAFLGIVFIDCTRTQTRTHIGVQRFLTRYSLGDSRIRYPFLRIIVTKTKNTYLNLPVRHEPL